MIYQLKKNLKIFKDDDMILDVGSKTLVEIKKIIDNSSTILWNGPLGYFENKNFSQGSLESQNILLIKMKKFFLLLVEEIQLQ